MNKQNIPSIGNIQKQHKKELYEMKDMLIEGDKNLSSIIEGISLTLKRIIYIYECDSEAEKRNMKRPLIDKLRFKNKTNWLEVAHESALKINNALISKQTF